MPWIILHFDYFCCGSVKIESLVANFINMFSEVELKMFHSDYMYCEHFKSRSLRVLGAKFGRNRLQVLWKSYRYSHSWLMITRKTYLNLWWFWAILRWAEINCECVPCNLKNFKIATAWALQTKLYKTHLLPQDIHVSKILINLFSGQTIRSSIQYNFFRNLLLIYRYFDKLSCQ